MEFNIRAISLVESVSADARIPVAEFGGREVEFRSGISYTVKLPHAPESFSALTEPEKTLTALRGWARVYRYPHDQGENIHILAPADSPDGDLVFYRVDFRQPPKPRRGLRPAVEVIGSAVLNLDDCSSWLIELSCEWRSKPEQRQRQFVLSRPCPSKPRRMRLAWVGPAALDGLSMADRLDAIGNVFGVEIIRVGQQSYRHVQSRLVGSLPLHSVIICRHFAGYINEGAVPPEIPPTRIHFCDSADRLNIEQQVMTWIELCDQEGQREQVTLTTEGQNFLLAIMLRGMLSHAKIGQFKHCQKETVLKGIRARHLNVATAVGILDANSEMYQDTKSSSALFLWKDHNDGRRYFLNPSQLEHIKNLVTPSAA